MLELIIAVLVIAWIAGFALHLGGAAIHAILVIALIVFLVRVLQGRTL